MAALQSVRSFITKTNVLWISFFTTIFLTLLFPLVAARWNLIFMDDLVSPTKVRELLEQMSAQQKSVHLWTTATLDVAYPFVYGSFLAGTALRFFHKYGSYLALPALLTVLVDLLEGVIQVLALTETVDLLGPKAYITALKFGLFFIAVIIVLVGWAKWLLNSRQHP